MGSNGNGDPYFRAKIDVKAKLGFLLAEVSICPTCGRRIPKKNPHRMDKSKVRLLQDIAKLNRSGHEWVKCEEGRFLVVDDERYETSYCVGVGARRLKWFGLLDKLKRREALYRVNANGIAFLRGDHSVPAIIWCRQGLVEVESDDRVFIGEITGVHLEKEYWDSYPARQRRWPDGRSTDAANTDLGVREGID